MLRLVDRARDFIVTAGGKTLSPSYIENLVRASPYIAEAMVIGHGRKYVTALVEIDYDAIADWARNRSIAYAGFTSLAQHAEVRGLIETEIGKANASLARVEQIKSFRILPEGARPGGGRRARDADAEGEARPDARALQGVGGIDVRRARRTARRPRNRRNPYLGGES